MRGPDHSTFPKNLHGFRDSALLRRVFEGVMARAASGRIGRREGFVADASVIEADGSCGRKIDGKPTNWPEAENLRAQRQVGVERRSVVPVWVIGLNRSRGKERHAM
jgi:hypothetical protein